MFATFWRLSEKNGIFLVLLTCSILTICCLTFCVLLIWNLRGSVEWLFGLKICSGLLLNLFILFIGLVGQWTWSWWDIYIYNILLMAVEYVFVASHCIGYNFQFEMELLFLDQGLSIVMDPGGNSWISICVNTWVENFVVCFGYFKEKGLFGLGWHELIMAIIYRIAWDITLGYCICQGQETVMLWRDVISIRWCTSYRLNEELNREEKHVIE